MIACYDGPVGGVFADSAFLILHLLEVLNLEQIMQVCLLLLRLEVDLLH